ncbi:uncharacterized protein EV154DRAFT_324162 [Mucor mucedo]|uniref:uncharacterized protein n=1 Tax=Mucor mucedo TaxID=29922 RepID=UPI00221E59E1|nr:uncharacterized protein EV154DRAFT_324162 [Mucor mucedo]KAI7888042.1 hypothetical protein EV154DRAFT_324162 [Mucor mucedo]
MEGYCDFSRYKHCISFGFDCIQTVSKSISNDDHNRDWDYEKKEYVKFPSIVYNTVSEVVIARGKSEVGEVQLKHDVDLCCVLNIFMELNNVFLKAPQRVSKSDMLDNVITSEVVKFLQDEMNEWEKALKCSKSDFCYAFTLPTGWNYEIQEKLIRPLFISAGLISKYNHPDRLLFFTQLESLFRCIQSDDRYFYKNIEVEYGRQYAMCSLNFAEGEIFVNLDLSSAQYPSLTSIDSKYVPQSLKSASFKFPFELKEKQTRIKAIVEKKCDTLSLTNVHKLTDILTNEGNTKGLPQWMRRIYDPEGNFKISDEDILNLAPFQEFLNYRPFKQLQDLRYKKYSLENEEIRALKSITITDIYGEFLEEEAFFTDKLNDLFQNTNKAKLTTLMISFTKDYTKAHHALVLLKLVEKWLKSFDKQQGFYRLLTRVVKGPYEALSFQFGI